MSARPVISYDDITLPYNEQSKPSSSHAGNSGPAKTRKKKNNQKRKYQAEPSQSRAASGPTSQQQYGEETVADEDYEGESRMLTHEEIWDDSALVDAWEAAMEEYNAYHGPEKDWKKEPVQKSPLWYNIPVDSSKQTANLTIVRKSSGLDASTTNNNPTAETDSKPLDFDTFMPMHNPSFDPSFITQGAGVNASYIPDTPAGAMVSQDEAFQRATNAMYWGGYWTAMYHCQQHLSQSQKLSTDDASAEGEDEESEIEVDDDEAFVTTER